MLDIVDRIAEEIRDVIAAGGDYRKAAESVLALIRTDVDDAADRVSKVVCLKCKGKGEYEVVQPFGTDRAFAFRSFVFCQCGAGSLLRQAMKRPR